MDFSLPPITSFRQFLASVWSPWMCEGSIVLNKAGAMEQMFMSIHSQPIPLHQFARNLLSQPTLRLTS